MSHFSVLVITENPDQVEAALQPYHEYECTGIEDEYVQLVDCTDKVSKRLNKSVFVGLNSKGLLDYEYTEERAKKELIDYKTMTFKEYYKLASLDEKEEIKEYFGYDYFDGKWVNKTNPNAKWDWWMIGGRWSGFLKPINPKIGVKGRAGIMGSQYDEQGVDQRIKSNVDFDTRRTKAAIEAAETYDKAMQVINNRDWLSWDEVLQIYKPQNDIDSGRTFYRNQAVIKDLSAAFDNPFFEFDDFIIDRETYIKQKSNAAIQTFAVVKDGKWYERGDMGWFGCVSDEKSKSEWTMLFMDLLNSTPDDYCLTIIDCHI